MKILIEIPEDKVAFGLKVLKSLSFIKKIKPLSKEAIDLWENLEKSVEEVRLHKQGKIKLKSAEELLDEI